MRIVNKRITWSACLVAFLSFRALAAGASIDLTAFDGDAPIGPSTIQVDGQDFKAWQTSAGGGRLTFRPGTSPGVTSASVLYVAVTYLDLGYGRLTVTCRGQDGNTAASDKYTRVVLSNSREWVTSYQRLGGLSPSEVPEIQIGLEKARSQDNGLIISRVTVQDDPWRDAHFQFLLKEAWKRPYEGPTAPGVDNTTLKGKVMVGYQGWFRTPNDPCDRGWVHWGDMNKGQFTTDMWPDISAYPPEALEKAGEVKTLSGKTGYLFSSAWPEVVETHFKWMRDHKIDGAFVQRFLGDSYGAKGRPEWVLGNVRAAANQQGRIWAVEYDVSGYPDDKLLETLKRDWAWLVDDFGIKKDPAYAREGGKPVIFIWGMPFPDRKITPSTANAVVDFFKNDPVYGGNYVIGGIPSFWRREDQPWKDHICKYDGVLEWQSKNYAADVADMKAIGVDYYADVWPGFSWANLKHLPTDSSEQYTPREGGRFYEQLFSQAAQAGADRLFVGMFDEYDEGTAIMPMSDDPPPTPHGRGTVVKFFPVPGLEEHMMSVDRPQVKFAFDGTEPAPGISPTNFAMRWEGQIIPPADGPYCFGIEGPTGDSWALFIDGKKLLASDGTPGFASDVSASSAAVTLTAQQPVVYRLDYTHRTTEGALSMIWEGPSRPREEVPAPAFVDAWGRFVTNEGKPSDWWLQLTTEAKEMITGQRSPYDLSVP